jgi:hypothetical protein
VARRRNKFCKFILKFIVVAILVLGVAVAYSFLGQSKVIVSNIKSLVLGETSTNIGGRLISKD